MCSWGAIVKSAKEELLMKLEDAKKFLKENAESEEVKAFLEGLQGQKQLDLDTVKAFVEQDKDAKSWLDSVKDVHLTKGISTFKEKTLPKLLDEEIKKKFPEADPKDLELQKLQKEVEQMKQEKLYESLKNKALSVASEKKLPTKMIDLLIAQDEEGTMKNLGLYEEILSQVREEIATNEMRDGYKPPANDGNTVTNPFSKQTWNLTEQGKLYRDNPELAKQLQAQANQ